MLLRKRKKQPTGRKYLKNHISQKEPNYIKYS